MKKFVLSSVFAVLMVFSSTTVAHADEFCALGSYRAGEEISAYIAMVSNEATVEAEGLPEGLRLEENPGDMGKHLSLEGKAMRAGELSFSISVSEEPGIINCSAYFEPATPIVTSSGDISCSVNDPAQLSVSASVSDGGSLSYQWYSGVGFSALPIEGATGPSYSPDTSAAGSHVYYCLVTNISNGYSSSVESDAMLVNVSQPRITGIEIETLPTKLIYAPGDSLDTNGLSLRVSYDNASYSIIDHGFEASPSRFDNPGKQLVELSYEGFRCYYEVETSLSAIEVEGIGVLTLPRRTEYELGELIDTDGLVIRAYTANGHIDIDNGFEVSPEKFSEDGRQTVTVSFGGKTCSFTVTVEDSNTLKSIAMASLPTRREYAVGDSVDVSGMSLRLIYGGRSELINEGFDYSPKELLSPGPQEITVTYAGHSIKFSINVKDKAASPSPKPSASQTPVPTAAPESAQPSETPVRLDRDHQARDVNALVKIIFAVAVISLIGLAGYIFWMQKRGKR